MMIDQLCERAEAAIDESRRVKHELDRILSDMRFIAEHRGVVAEGIHRWLKEVERKIRIARL
ncbi:MAG TPA: hypothetical protein VHN20_01740 [Beijerinckiaceae bacterium]|nr:hypothetical protein [Beijerinckiaceae bacterium]